MLCSTPATHEPVLAGTAEPVLLVDDDPVLLRAFVRILQRHFAVLTAGSAEEAMHKFEADGPFAVVVSDYWMGDMNGIDLLEHIRRHAPATSCILLSGDASLNVAERNGRFLALEKPCSGTALRNAIAAGAAQYRAAVRPCGVLA